MSLLGNATILAVKKRQGGRASGTLHRAGTLWLLHDDPVETMKLLPDQNIIHGTYKFYKVLLYWKFFHLGTHFHDIQTHMDSYTLNGMNYKIHRSYNASSRIRWVGYSQEHWDFWVNYLQASISEYRYRFPKNKRALKWTANLSWVLPNALPNKGPPNFEMFKPPFIASLPHESVRMTIQELHRAYYLDIMKVMKANYTFTGRS